MKFDLHCHTKGGSIDAKVALPRYIELLKDHGFSGMLVTDHDSYKGFRQWKAEQEASASSDAECDAGEDFVVLEGVEYDTRDAGHILVILPDGVKLDVLQVRGLKLETLLDLVHHFGGILGPSHPFGTKGSSIMHFKLIHRHPNLLKKFDFIEGFNTCENHTSNYLARKLAELWDKPCTGGSDSHSEDCVGKGYTVFNTAIRCNNDLIAAIQQRQIAEIGGIARSESRRARVKNHTVSVWAFRTYNRIIGFFLALRRRRHLKFLPLPLSQPFEASEESCSAETP